jgi:hypothetical protein
MQRSQFMRLAAALAICSSACTPAKLAAPSDGSVPMETGGAPHSPSQALIESATTVAVNPTDAYAIVARGMLACWFGADGPLRNSHVFHAEATAPAQGGEAEIVIHERNAAQRDQRGLRALRVTFAPNTGGSRVGIAVLKAQPALSGAMVGDVESWIKGGSDCQLRKLYGNDAALQSLQPQRASHH